MCATKENEMWFHFAAEGKTGRPEGLIFKVTYANLK
jgi:hypothetical protein